MIIANFTCPKCKAVLDLENVEEGQLVDCPQCNAPFEIPRRKANPIYAKAEISRPRKIHKGKALTNVGFILMCSGMVASLIEPVMELGILILFVGLFTVVAGRMAT